MNGLKLDGGEFVEGSSAVVGSLDPGHYCQSQLVAGLPVAGVEDVF